ncbi:MAG: class I SAM-dependent methyltransferase [Chloroflexota bacterium]
MSSQKNPWLATRTRTGAEYDLPYQLRAQAGEDIHGEANLVEKLVLAHCKRPEGGKRPFSILDAGCGTGRMGIELNRRGFNVVGVDLDDVMLKQAKAKAPQIAWHLADLSTVQLNQTFDAIVLAGNVMIYVTPDSEKVILQNMVHHLNPNGLLLAAFELTPKAWTDLTLDQYEQLASNLGLKRLARWSTWEQAPWQEGDHYVVSLHQRKE